MPHTDRYLIELESPEGRSGLSSKVEALESAGVVVDRERRPILIDPERHLFAVRGVATKQAKATASRKFGVRFFRDEEIKR